VAGPGSRTSSLAAERLVNGGWHVLRFSWHDLAHRPEAVLTEIRDALRIR